jgi:AcrR family transcriptional regulator
MASASRPRRRRPSLDQEVIVDAALRLAVSPDHSAVSFRKLGQELGADPTAVYRHFRDKDELLEAALDRLLVQVVAAVPADLPWRERLRAAAIGYLDAVVSHPVVGVQAGHRTTGGPGELAMLELLLAGLAEAGLSDEQVLEYYPLLAGYAASMAAAQAAYRLQDDRLEPTERAWVGTYGLVDLDRYPVSTRLREELARLRDSDVFVSGFELLLDAVVAAASSAPVPDHRRPDGP